MGRPELGRSSAVQPLGCFGGLGAGGAAKALPAPPAAPKGGHLRKRSFGSWFSRSADDNAAEEANSKPAADKSLAEQLSGLQLGDPSDPGAPNCSPGKQQQRTPAKGAPPPSPAAPSPQAGAAPPARVHRRRWSFGRQVVPEAAAAAALQPGLEPGLLDDEAQGESSARSSFSSVDDDSTTGSVPPAASSAAASAAAAAAAALRPRGGEPPSPGQQQAQQQQQEQQQHGEGQAASGSKPPSPASSAAPPATPPQPKGPGYRRLWHSITSVRKGDPLPANGSGSPGSDVTVESLVKAAQRLKPGQPVTDAVRDGLGRLDSRAVAALLKELSKAGLPHRASELFDWLRSLPADHELARLADLYSYTTIISQCGGHQQLRRALELVAEMRSRGIEANIHTYSALMSVCVKCNECELALDVFHQLMSEGCTPNLVTFNILIDIHGKTGQWAKAVEVLSMLHAQGCTPEARTYNTIISACAKAGQPDAARGVYERMLADGVQPTGTTYTSLISAYGKAGQVEEAVRIYQDMAARGCERNVITYSSLISACEKAGRWELALRLWEEMRREGCRPNVVTFNGLLGACAQAGMWAKASEVFDSMQASGCRPDAVTFSVLISAYERGGQWRRCLQAFERMQQQGFRPDACVYNSVLDALVASGLVAAQHKAAQLCAAAHRQGHLRLTSLSAHDSTATAYTYGAAFNVALRWLGELRDAPPAAAMPLAFAAAAGGTRLGASSAQPVTLVLTRGKHCRGDHSFGPVQQALTACFEAFSAPVSTELRSQGLVLLAEPLALTAWLASPGAAALLSPLAAAAAGASPVLSSALLADDVAADMQCSRAFAAVLEFEGAHGVNGAALAGSPTAAALRQHLVSDLVILSHTLGVREESTLDAVQLCDWAVSRGISMEQGLAPLYAAAMLLLATRQSGEAATVLSQETALAQLTGLPLSTVLEAEAHLSAALGGDTSAVSSLRVLQLYLERLGCSLPALEKCQLLELMALAAVDLVRKAALNPGLAHFRPSVVAAACLVRAREGLGLAPAWPRTLQSMTAYQPGAGGQLQLCLDAMALLGVTASA